MNASCRPAPIYRTPTSRNHTLRFIGVASMIQEGQEIHHSELHKLRSPEGLVSMVGFGSLLSPTSARTTFPELQNFRIERLDNWRRVFAHTATIFFERGIARPETMEISSLRYSFHYVIADFMAIITVFFFNCLPRTHH